MLQKIYGTKKAIGYYNRIKSSDITEIWQAYAKPSLLKVNAFENCRSKCAKQNGFNFRVIGHNTSAFVVGWFTETETALYVNIETAYNSYKYLVYEYKEI